VLSSLRQPVLAVHPPGEELDGVAGWPKPPAITFRSDQNRKKGNRARVTCGAATCAGVRLRFGALSGFRHQQDKLATYSTVLPMDGYGS
jgi:hypothetical protein